MLSGKQILIGITGGIAAYKIPYLIRAFRKQNGNIRCITTHAAKHFITEETLSELSGSLVYSDIFAAKSSIEHIELSRWADVLLISPATANTIGKMAGGIADNLLTTIYLSFRGQVIVAPSMNTAMWEHGAVQENIRLLKRRGVIIVNPEDGELACGETGKGRLAEPDHILEHVIRSLSPPFLSGKKVLVTAGPTREFIDPVRYLGNASSGKMGHMIAKAAWRAHADVTIISGPCSQKTIQGVKTINVTSAEEMMNAVKDNFSGCDIFISNAAVSDFCPESREDQKIKKEKMAHVINVKSTPDILNWAGNHKKNQVVIGFALETTNKEENAQHKLFNKKCDYIALNDIENIGGDEGSITLYSRNNKIEIPKQPKPLLAMNFLSALFKQ